MFSPDKQYSNYMGAKALGELAIASEYTVVIEGYENLKFLTKQFPIPVVSAEDVIEVPELGGAKGFTSQIPRTDFRGPVAMKETVAGQAEKFLDEIAQGRTVSNRPKVNITIYRGDETDFTRKWECKDATFFGFDPFDYDMENRSQLVALNGQVAYRYFPGVD